VLPIVSPEVINDSDNAKAEDPAPKVDIPSGDAKVDDAPHLVVPPTDTHPVDGPVVFSIDH